MKPQTFAKDAGILNAISAVRSYPRIVGGTPAEAGEFPWIAALYYTNCTPGNCQFCGGSLIRPNWILTAAHCAVGNTAADVSVFLGSLDLNGQGEKIQVAEIIVHEDFDPNTLDNDVALLRLSSNSAQRTIAVIPDGDPEGLTRPGNVATIIGWGATSEGGQGSEVLLKTNVPIVSNADAALAYAPYNSAITDNMVAAGETAGGRDTCQGDSGGPFVIRNASSDWVLAGVTSWGIGCARPNLPGLYARLANYAGWIREHTGE